MKTLLTIIILFFITSTLKAQVQLYVSLPSVYTIIDTSKYWPSGRLKTTSSHLKKQGFVLYSMENGLLVYKFFDSEKKPVDKKYKVSWDDRESNMLQLRPIFADPKYFDVKKGLKVDTLTQRR